MPTQAASNVPRPSGIGPRVAAIEAGGTESRFIDRREPTQSRLSRMPARLADIHQPESARFCTRKPPRFPA
jgi:hypothetical protein